MKKIILISVGGMLLLSSCGTYMGSGAYMGSSIGSILGSAIGGISDGPRGSDIGTIIGMAGGAVVGAAIGNAADKAQQQKYEDYQAARKERMRNRQSNMDYAVQGQTDSGFDPTNSGDDRIYDYNDATYTGSYTASSPNTYAPSSVQIGNIDDAAVYNADIEIRNPRFVDENQDNRLSAGEMCKVIFEVRNHTSQTLYDVQPIVQETTGNKHIFISPTVHVEKIAPGKGIRYTAMVKADNRLKDGTAHFRISVVQGNNQVVSKFSEFNIRTSRR